MLCKTGQDGERYFECCTTLVHTCTDTAGAFSPKSCFSGLGSDAAWLVLLVLTCCGGMYHLFRSYFWTIKSFIFCSSLDSGSAGCAEFHSPSQTFLQYCKVNKNILRPLELRYKQHYHNYAMVLFSSQCISIYFWLRMKLLHDFSWTTKQLHVCLWVSIKQKHMVQPKNIP